MASLTWISLPIISDAPLDYLTTQTERTIFFGHIINRFIFVLYSNLILRQIWHFHQLFLGIKLRQRKNPDLHEKRDLKVFTDLITQGQSVQVPKRAKRPSGQGPTYGHQGSDNKHPSEYETNGD